MAVVHFVRKVPAADGVLVPAKGGLRFTPTARRVIVGAPDVVVLPASFSVQLVNGAADVTLEPTTGAWVWRVDEYCTGTPARTTHVAVPAVAELDDTDLVIVDPATLTPAAAPEPAWVAMAQSTITTGTVTGDDLILTRTDGTTVNAGNVRGAAGATGATGATGPAGPAGLDGNTADLNDAGYDIILLIGQSNMQGDSGGATSAVLDITDPRVWTYGATGTYGGQIVQASDPLAHRGGSSIVGPGMSFARWYAGTIPGNRRVLLVPAAYNGTAFGSGTNRWDPTTAWPVNMANLYALAIAQTMDALAAAGANSRVVAALWVQGESDAINTSMPADTYRTYLEYLIDGLRARLSKPNLPFVIGSMVPEFIAVNSVRQGIDGVHSSTPTRKPYTAYVLGPSGMQRGDNLHYSPAGQREQGQRLLSGLATARANTAPSGAVAANPPTADLSLVNSAAPAITGTATVGSTLTTTTGGWLPKPDSYAYQWRRNGANISGATGSTYLLVTADNGTSVTCRVTANRTSYTATTADSNALTIGSAAVASDDFNRADSATTMGTLTTGQTWVASVGTWGISTNRAYAPGNVANSLALVDVGASDYTVQATVVTLDPGTTLIVRGTDGNNWYGLHVPSAGQMAFYKKVAGTTTALASSLGTAAAGNIIKIVASGSTFSLYRNGTLLTTVNDSALATGKPGLRADNNVGRWDDFSVTTP